MKKYHKGVSANLIELPIIIYPKVNWFVSEVPIFNIASQGKTIEEVLENIKEAIELYFEDEDSIKFDFIKSLPNFFSSNCIN